MADQYKHLFAAVVPSRYAVRFELRDMNPGAAFEGTLRVELAVQGEGTREIELHAKQLEVLEAIAVSPLPSRSLGDGRLTADGDGVSATEIALDDAAETVLLRFPETLRGDVELKCRYRGRVSGPLLGVYHCNFAGDCAGVSTHFEPIYARYAFPCVDEPRAKARFDVTIVAPKGLTALSNMPARAQADLADGLEEHHFETTPLMSTYLLAFSVGSLGSIHAPEGSAPVPMTLYASAGQENLGRFALEVAASSLTYFEDFFGVKFPLPKLDLMVPPSFPIGGMENWGLITLTNRALLDDNASFMQRYRVAGLVAHEVSHMWFGNLVTPSWWEDLWLKEGFASWVSVLPLDAQFPGWRVWDRWAVDCVIGNDGAMEVDQYQDTHAVEVPLNHPSEIQEIFDGLSYDKGSVVVNMLYHALGRETFQKGLSAWFEKYKFGNCVTRDLWDVLAEISGKPVEKMMASWTRQEGFPVLEVRASSMDTSHGDWLISQRRFVLNGSVLADGEPNSKMAQAASWIVPLRALRALPTSTVDVEASEAVKEKMPSDPSSPVFLDGAEVRFPRREAWVKLNAGQHAPYRVLYSPEVLKELAKVAASGNDGPLSPLDRIGLVADGFALFRAGRLSTAPMMDLLQGLLLAERDSLVKAAHLEVAGRLLRIFGKRVAALPRFFARLLVAEKDRLGWGLESGPNESQADTALRPVLLSLLGLCEEESVSTEAVQLTEAYLAASRGVLMGRAPPRVDTRSVALRLGLSAAPHLWQPLCARLKATTLNEERDHVVSALTAGHRERAELEAWVTDALSGGLDTMDWSGVFVGLSKNKAHPTLAWEMLVRHWDAVFGAWGESQFKMKQIVSYAIPGAPDAATVKGFFADHPCDVASKTIGRCLEAMAVDVAFEQRSGDVDEYLNNTRVEEAK
eukprot:TRINITY_DN62294_c0_g1_i1.p1 TRINITY_DN62294_c0_g1~~TRINITY_DN62294_c0_g1_i1.p1  ORF type:complete len:934 (+),score=173.95 TRINITY_DN62294_c0_g1_i1:69-2804(+)